MPIPLFEPLHPVQKAAFQRMSADTKLGIVQNLIDTARALKKSQVRNLHPDWSDEEINAHLKNMFLHVTT
jgi:hypothetical protein